MNYTADSNVLNVLEMPAGEEGEKYGSCLAAVVGSQMVWVERPILDVMKECAESYSAHLYGSLQLSKMRMSPRRKPTSLFNIKSSN